LKIRRETVTENLFMVSAKIVAAVQRWNANLLDENIVKKVKAKL
jgi:hypothetical protein